MLALLLILALSVLSPFTSASASGQFQLSFDKHLSVCFMDCHVMAINAVHRLEGDNPLGGYDVITNNCKDGPYIQALSSCLVSVCSSAPDVAYAFEFGQRWCGKAGVDVSETLRMPETYKLAAKEYLESAAYINGASSSVSVPNAALLTTGLLAVSILALAT